MLSEFGLCHHRPNSSHFKTDRNLCLVFTFFTYSTLIICVCAVNRYISAVIKAFAEDQRCEVTKNIAVFI